MLVVTEILAFHLLQ